MAIPIGEKSWLAYVEENAKSATDLESCVNVVELYKRAVDAEPSSVRLWLSYCTYLSKIGQPSDNGQADWSEEEAMLAKELFPSEMTSSMWKQGYESVKYRLDDSNQLWDRWMSLEREETEKSATADAVRRISEMYRDRLMTPHITWDETSQAFSSFISQYDQDAWEDAMKDITAKAQPAKALIEERDAFELKIQQARRQNNTDIEKSTMLEYLDWETFQSRRANDQGDGIATELCHGLYSRALTGLFETDEQIWYEFVVFLSSAPVRSDSQEQLLSGLRRAVQHCPWSGRLWNRYIISAEEAGFEFSEIESIKQEAMDDSQLYRNGMEGAIRVQEAWCGFLKRLSRKSSDHVVDVSEAGIRKALDEVKETGKRLFGKDFQGDPTFRLERLYIQYLTERKGALDKARSIWERLSKSQLYADNHDFWLRYYSWEMLLALSSGDSHATPAAATSVLRRAAGRRTIDWPEKVLEVYSQHCNDYEDPTVLRKTVDTIYRAEKGIKKRREREEKEAAAAYAAYYGTAASESAPLGDSNDASPGGQKRKLEAGDDVHGVEGAYKRQKGEQDGKKPAVQAVTDDTKRDRENSTIIVSNLPTEVTQNKIRQYFKDYGQIKGVTALFKEADGTSATALLEFSSAEEAQSALLRDMKYFGESQIRVGSGLDLTVYVANFPPAADEAYIRNIFSDCGAILSIRWPSLKVNSHRRFCYVSFRDREASAAAVQKDGMVIDEKYKLLAKYSDPSQKKNREGAVAEGREVHLSNLDTKATEQEVTQIFSKYGTVTRVNIPRGMTGKGRGFGFVDYETKEQAALAASELNNTKLKSQIMQVEVSKVSKVKHSATTTQNGKKDPSARKPSRDADGDSTMPTTDDTPSVEDINSRTIALMGLPDTVNDARVRALVEPYGDIVKLTLQPGHGGAKIEFEDAAMAGKASLHLNTLEYEGHKLRTGEADELRFAKPASLGSQPTDTKAGNRPKANFIPPAMQRRPGPRAGPKRGLGFISKGTSQAKASSTGAVDAGSMTTGSTPKSNADFKAMFLNAGTAAGTTEVKEKPTEDK